MNHQELVKKITQELLENDNVLMLILYGSVSRHEEKDNSDIDLLLISKSQDFQLQKRQQIRNGITVEFVEIQLDFLQNNIIAEKGELPIFLAFTNGILLFDKISAFEELKTESQIIIDGGPPIDTQWENESYNIKQRSDITEIYRDLLDVDDEISFNYIVALLINRTIPLFYQNNRLWHTTKKKTMNFLKSECYEGYQFVEILLCDRHSLQDKRDAAKGLLEYVFKPYGGIINGNVIVFTLNNGRMV